MLSSPVIIYALVFISVAGLVGLLAFVFRESGPKTATRLDLLIGGKRKREEEQSQDILRKSAFEGDKQSLIQALTPKFLSPQKMFEQADCHIKPGTLTLVGVILA